MNALIRDKRLPVWLLAAATVLSIPLLLHFQRESGIWQDEWTFLLWRDGWSLNDIFGDFNGHLLPLTPIVFNIDRELFYPGATGLLTACSLTAQVAVVWGAFAYARKRVGEWIAAGGALLLLFYGSGYELIVWNFNFGWMTAIAAGIWAIVFFESSDTTKNQIIASVLLVIALFGDNNALVFVAAILAYALFKETRRRAINVVATPLVLFGIWWLIEGTSQAFHPKTLPDWVASMIESTFAGLTGDIGGVNSWGTPLAVLVVGVMIYLFAKERTIRPSLASALSMPIVYVAVVTIGRGGVADPSASRYRYTLILLVGLALAEQLRGKRLSTPGARISFVLVLGFMLVSNLATMADGAASIRGGFAYNRVYATALVRAGEKVATNTDFLSIDPGLGLNTRAANADAYRFLTEGGGEKWAWTPEQLAAQPPAVQLQVQEMVQKMKSQSP
ncbi:MAG: hypothetical protein JHC98_02400 [Thermoleophilaceae bacterium]|nr:hypothetical protein [Thermoleophilaceae bacterium]